jgi:DNA-3-methyladenine glycosylase II
VNVGQATRKESPERYLSRIDPALGKVIRKSERYEFTPSRSGLHEFAQIIVYQQLSGAAAKTIFGRILQTAKCRRLTLETLGKLSDRQLKAAGVSPQKLKYLRDLQDKVKSGEFEVKKLASMSDEEAITAITSVKGLGQWSAEMYLMFVLGRPDVFSAGDNGLQTAVRRLYGFEGSRKELTAFAERWKPYRTIAAWYLWRYLSITTIA